MSIVGQQLVGQLRNGDRRWDRLYSISSSAWGRPLITLKDHAGQGRNFESLKMTVLETAWNSGVSLLLKAFITVTCVMVTECAMDGIELLRKGSAMYLSNEHSREGKTHDQPLPVLPEAKVRNRTTQLP